MGFQSELVNNWTSIRRDELAALRAALKHSQDNLQIVGKSMDESELLLIQAQTRLHNLEAAVRAVRNCGVARVSKRSRLTRLYALVPEETS